MRLSMRLSVGASAVAVLAGSATAQNMSICDKYTTALLVNNTAANQYTLLTLLVNTVGLGNFTGPGTTHPTLPGSLVPVPGILAPATVNGVPVNLAPYFTGALASTNRDGLPVSVNFLDGGGAAPILADPLSSGASGSAQAQLFQHLYQFFGKLLGCSGYGEMGFPAYAGGASMQSVHRYMDLSPPEVTYFILQVGLAAQSFGATTADITTVANALTSLFAYRCSPATTVIPAQGAQLQAICQNVTCPVATSGAVCSAYPAVSPPALAAAAATGSSSAAAAAGSATASGTTASSKAVIGSSVAVTGTSATGSAATKTSTSTGAIATYTGGAAMEGAGAGSAVVGLVAVVAAWVM